MEELIILKYQAKTIENALRLCVNQLECATEKTALDREVMRAVKHIKSVLKISDQKQPLTPTP